MVLQALTREDAINWASHLYQVCAFCVDRVLVPQGKKGGGGEGEGDVFSCPGKPSLLLLPRTLGTRF